MTSRGSRKRKQQQSRASEDLQNFPYERRISLADVRRFLPPLDPIHPTEHIKAELEQEILQIPNWTSECWPYIRSRCSIDTITSDLTFRIPKRQMYRLDYVKECALNIFRLFATPMKLNICFGYLLKNVEVGSDDAPFRYYTQSNNTSVTGDLVFLYSEQDVRNALQLIEATEVFETLMVQSGLTTKWLFAGLLAVTFKVYTMHTKLLLGGGDEKEQCCCRQPIPKELKEDRNILSLETTKDTHLRSSHCMFKCIALTLEKKQKHNRSKQSSIQARQLADKFALNCLGVDPLCYDGSICQEQIEMLEAYFKVRIYLSRITGQASAKLQTIKGGRQILRKGNVKSMLLSTVVRAPCLHLFNSNWPIVYCCVHGRHAMLIKNIKLFAHFFPCASCGKVFTTQKRLNKHLKGAERCRIFSSSINDDGVSPLIRRNNDDDKQREYTVGGAYLPPDSIYDELIAYGIDCPAELKYAPHHIIAIDTEQCFEELTDAWETRHVKALNKLHMVNFALASNVPGISQDEKCFYAIDLDSPADLSRQMLMKILSIAKRSYQLHLERYSETLNHLELMSEVSRQSDLFDFWTPLAQRLKRKLRTIPVFTFNGR